MDEDDCGDRAGSKEQKRRVRAKYGRVGKLEHRTRNSRDERDVGPSETKLVKVMNVSTAKDKRG